MWKHKKKDSLDKNDIDRSFNMEMKYENSKGKKFIGHLSLGENEALPYILVIPEDLEKEKELVVESLNFEGTNIIDKIAPHVIEQLKDMVEVIDDAPILIPFTPDVRGGVPYYQQLSRECFEEANNGEYKIEYLRVDLQIINTINNAKNTIKQETGKDVANKIFLNGYSSSGVFAQRFALIHPEIVGRVLIGGASGSIPLPTEEFDYPLGIKDFRELFGTDFNESKYRKIQFAYYVGELETNTPAWERDTEGKLIERNQDGQILNRNQIIPPMHDMSYYTRSIDSRRGRHQRQILGEDLSQRHKNCIEWYENNGYKITSKIYRGAEHRGIFSRSNPCFETLLRDIILFYRNGESFAKDIAGVEEISMKPQRQREQKSDKDKAD